MKIYWITRFPFYHKMEMDFRKRLHEIHRLVSCLPDLAMLINQSNAVPISTSPARHADFHWVDHVSQDYRRKLKAIAIFFYKPPRIAYKVEKY